MVCLAGCADAPSRHPLEGRIWDVRAGAYAEPDELLDRLRTAQHRLLGEVHDNPEHHRLRAALIRGIGAPAHVYFEQFDGENDARLRIAQVAGADADALASAGRLDEKSWRWPLHRPVVRAALNAGLPVRAANLSRADARRIALAESTDPVDPAAVREMIDGHCGMLPERAAPGMVRAQRARDETMAAALSGARQGSVLIAGNGHVRRDRGVPAYLPKDADVVSVGFLETREGKTDPRAYSRGAAGAAAYDYVWFTAPQPRPDPCEALRKR